MKPVLLALSFLSPEHYIELSETFELVYAPDAAGHAAAIAAHGARIRVVLTIGSVGLTAAQIDLLPTLTLVCALGAGYENIAVAHAKARCIGIANGAGTNDDCVADHAMGLLIAAVRGIPKLDTTTRADFLLVAKARITSSTPRCWMRWDRVATWSTSRVVA